MPLAMAQTHETLQGRYGRWPGAAVRPRSDCYPHLNGVMG
jgi:hypothetical protein